MASDPTQTPQGTMQFPRYKPSMDGQTLKGEYSPGFGNQPPTTPPNAYHLDKEETPRSDSIPGDFSTASRKASHAVHGPRKWLGLHPHAELPEDANTAEHNHLWWSKIKITFKEPFAEMWGTFILVLFGTCPLHLQMLVGVQSNQIRQVLVVSLKYL